MQGQTNRRPARALSTGPLRLNDDAAGHLYLDDDDEAKRLGGEKHGAPDGQAARIVEKEGVEGHDVTDEVEDHEHHGRVDHLAVVRDLKEPIIIKEPNGRQPRPPPPGGGGEAAEAVKKRHVLNTGR